MVLPTQGGGIEGSWRRGFWEEFSRNAGYLGSIPVLGRSPGEGNGIPLQYSCLENPMDRGGWEATVHGVAKSQPQLSDFTFFSFFHSRDEVTLASRSCVSISCSVASDSATAWTVASQAPLSMGFSRQEYCSGVPSPSPGICPTQGSNLGLLHCRRILN